ncbi:hypothetical protein [Christiangramia crocea]|uniref:Uncharacterized protein n=1 Tax=Christiangramia crocea TaxID=2904124 RepID=A0A9X2A6I3_9FLAO|nr:hypothetical protein [Gramella crocea]MCG9971026.1 hypothetical protein [Gramella crocea]
MKTNSLTALEKVNDFRSKHYQKIISGLNKIGKGSYKDIARVIGIDKVAVMRRLSELERKGFVSIEGTKKCPESNRPVSVYKIN